MAVITAGLYKLELFQMYFGQECINTFWYISDGGLNDGQEELASLFDTSVMPAMVACQNSGVSYINIRVTPIFGTGVEENRTPSAGNGTVAGEQLPPFVVASLRLNRTTNELRSGWKRISGLVEENVGATSFSGAFNVLLNSLGTALAANLVGASDFYRLAIVRRPFSTKAMSADWEAIDVGTVTTLNRPTTQNSRKPF